MTKTEVGRNFTLVYNSTWSPYIVPAAYRSQATKVSIVGSGLSYDATILGTGVLQFTKVNQISTSNNAIRYSIQSTPYQISMNVSKPQQVTITAPMFSKTLIYSPYQIFTKFPMSVKRGTNSTIGYKFIASAGSTGYISLSESYSLYAQSPFNITTKHPCTPDAQDVTILNCAIMYNATELVNNNYISLLPYLSVPSANNSIVALATDNLSSNILKLFYIDTGPMQLAPATQQTLLYTVRPNTLRVRINSTSMPSSDLLSKYIWFEYKFASGHFQYVQATYVSSTSISGITSYLFNCTTTFTLGTVGRVNITLWYRESDSSYYVMGTAFQISTNYIEAMYTDQINILESSLTATRVNTTVAVSLKTSFRATADYGTAEVAIAYQAPVTNATVYMPTVPSSSGQFDISLNSTVAGAVALNVVMHALGTYMTISASPVQFKFVDGNYFTPSYGSVAGGERVFMFNYDNSTSNNVHFVIDPTIIFNCVYDAPKKQQNCTTPVVQFDSFQSFEVAFPSKPALDIKYTTIITRVATIATTVYPTSTLVDIKINLDGVCEFVQGNGIFQVNSDTSTDYINDAFGSVDQLVLQRTFSIATADSYKATLLYTNPNLFEGIVPFSNSIPLEFIESTDIMFDVYSKRIGLVGSKFNVTVNVKYPDNRMLKNDILNYLKCVFKPSGSAIVYATEIVASTPGTNNITCIIGATSPHVGKLSIWFVNASAYQAGFSISKNSLDIIFMEPLSAISSPSATLNYGILPIVITTNITTDIALFPGVKYSCVYVDANNGGTPESADAIRKLEITTDNTFTCDIIVQQSDAYKFRKIHVDLVASVTQANQELILTPTPAVVHFMKRVQLNYVRPFVYSIGGASDTVTASVSVLGPETEQYTDVLATSHQLYCKYSLATQPPVWSYAPATLVSSSTASCEITVTHQDKVEFIDIMLWYNGGELDMQVAHENQLSFDIAANAVKMMFVQQPLLFSDSENMNDGILLRYNTLGKYINTNFTLPITQANDFEYHINSTTISGKPSSELKCNYTLGYNTACIVVHDALQVLHVPVQLNFTLTFVNKASRDKVTWNMIPVTFNNFSFVQRAYPYALSYTEYTEVNPATITFTLDGPMNLNYSYRCFVKYGTDSYSVVARMHGPYNFSCSGIHSNKEVESIPVLLQFIQPPTFYNSESFAVDISTKAEIRFVAPIRLNLPAVPVDSTRQFVIETQTSLPEPPTDVFTSSEYDHTLMMNDRGTYRSLQGCSVVPPSIVRCTLPTGLTFPKYPWYVRIEVFQQGVRANTLYPYLMYYQTPVFDSALPSTIVQFEDTFTTSWITFYGRNFIVGGNASVIYTCAEPLCITAPSLTTQQGECKVLTTTKISCPSPQFKLNTGVSSGVVSVAMTLVGTVFQTNLKITIYISKELVIKPFNTTCDPFVSKSIDISGEGYINGNVWIRFTDLLVYSIETQANVQVKSSEKLTIQTPTLWYLDFNYPKTLQFWISFDNGLHYHTNAIAKLDYTAPQQFSFYPYSYGAGQSISGMKITGVPNIALFPEHMIAFELFQGDTSTDILITCNSVYENCVGNNPLPAETSLLTMRMYTMTNKFVNKTRVYITAENQLQVRQHAAIQSVSPSRIIHRVTDKLSFVGDFSALHSIPALIVTARQGSQLQKLNIVSISETNLIISGFSNVKYISLRKIHATPLEIVVSLPGGTDEKLIFTTDTTGLLPPVELLTSYSIDAILNYVNPAYEDDDNAFTFQYSNLIVTGTNFPTQYNNSNAIRVRFTSASLFDQVFDISNISIVVESSTKIRLVSPLMANLTAFGDKYAYPLATLLGISFNWGMDYAYRTINYVNQYRQPIISSITPFIAPRLNLTVTVRGKYLTLTTFCGFLADQLEYISPISKTLTDSGSIADYLVTCPLSASVAATPNVKSLNMTVLTTYGQNASLTTFTYHETLNITSVSPRNSSTIGGIPILITVKGIEPGFDLYVRFSELISSVPCKIVSYNFDNASTSLVNCTVLSHANGPASVMLSYDQQNWFMQGGHLYDHAKGFNNAIMNYYYIPCDAGYTAPNFEKECTACPPGTYKTTAGIYSCISCTNGTFNEFYAQKNCTVCPLNTSSRDNATSLLDCVCNPGFYRNPKPVGAYCLPCPIGGNCRAYNTTIPPALKGYWHAAEDPYNFKKCFPAEACLGDGFRNCSTGYDVRAAVCGICDVGYYKWRNRCEVCGPDVWYKAILAVVLVIVITALFFAISSAKVSHLSSISIATSYWQIISLFASFDVQWPVTVSGTFTAASVTNFNVDFLSPSCLFPTIPHFLKWILVTLLPFYFLIAFILLYILGEIRTLIVNRTGKYIKIKYMAFREDKPYENKNKIKRYIVVFIRSIPVTIMNALIWLRNAFVWFIKAGATREQMRNFGNKIVNSYTSFLAFIYLFIMSQAALIFVCTAQPDGTSTLNASPDIICFVGYGDWPKMLALSIIMYVLFGIGAIVFFLSLFLYQRYLRRVRARLLVQRALLQQEEDDSMNMKLTTKLAIVERRFKNFNMRFKFMLARFKSRFFFWEAVITARKLLISILSTFLRPLLVVVFGIVVMFTALILHMRFVPFRYKFHNMMEYVVLVATNIVLLLGLLFYVDTFPTDAAKQFCIWLATIIIVASVVFVVLMMVFDVITRRLKDRKLVMERRKELVRRFGEMKKEELEKEYKKMFPSKFDTKTKQIDELDEDWQDDPEWAINYNNLLEGVEWKVITNPLVEDASENNEEIDYEALGVSTVVDFALPFYDDDESMSDEGKHETIRDITDDLFGITRIRKKIKQVKSIKKPLLQRTKTVLE
jgi:hypothetical protein